MLFMQLIPIFGLCLFLNHKSAKPMFNEAEINQIWSKVDEGGKGRADTEDVRLMLKLLGVITCRAPGEAGVHPNTVVLTDGDLRQKYQADAQGFISRENYVRVETAVAETQSVGVFIFFVQVRRPYHVTAVMLHFDTIADRDAARLCRP